MSRFIAAIGKEAAEKQSKSAVFLSGLGALGVEIAKNIIMTGVRRFTLHDTKNCTENDLLGQFFISKADIGQNRATQSLKKLKELNYDVKVDIP